MAQDGLGLRYIKSASGSVFRYSGNGAYLFGQGSLGGAVNAYRTADNTCIASLYIDAGPYVCPNFDGSGFFYSRGRDLLFFDMGTRTGSLLYTEPDTFAGIDQLSLSVDGSKLAFQSKRLSDSRNAIGVVDVGSHTLLRRIVLPVDILASQVAFVNGDGRILVAGNGLRMYSTATGAFIASKTNTGIYNFTLNPQRTRSFSVDSSNTETVCLDVTGNLTQVWKKGPIGLTSMMKCSADGNVLIDQRSNSIEYFLSSYSTADGTLLGGVINPVSPGSFIGWETAPDKNELVLPTYADTTRLEKWSFNTATGAGTQLADLSEGIGAVVANLGYTGTPVFASIIPGSSLVNVRFLASGGYIGTSFGYSPGPAPLPQLISPNGQFYVRVGYKTGTSGWGLHVHRFSDSALVASHLFTDAWDNPKTFGWANDSMLFVHNGPVNKRLRTLSFDGAALTKVRDYTNLLADEFRISSDGKRLVAWNVDNTNTKIFNNETGAAIGSFPMSSPNPATGVVYWTIVGANLLAMHEWVIIDGTQFKNQVRFVDMMNPALPVVNITGYIDNNVQVYDSGITRITPDGSLVYFLLIPKDLNADFSSKSKLTVMRTSDNSIIRSINNLPVSSWVSYSSGMISQDGTTFLASNGSAFFALDIPAVVASLTLNPTSVVGGNSSTATLTLSHVAGSGGQTVNLSADNGLGVPSSVTVPEGEKTVNFSVTTPGVDAQVIGKVTATMDGLTTDASLTVTPAVLTSLSFTPPSVDGGNNSTGTVSLNGKAGPSGVSVNLASNKAFVTVPASVTLGSGQTGATFTATTFDPGVTGVATVTGTAGVNSVSGNLEVRSAYTLTVDLQPGSVKGGNALELTLTLSPAPPTDRTFTLTGDSLLTPPPSVTILAGQTTVSVGVKSIPVLSAQVGTVTISNAFGFSKTATTTIDPPVLTGLLPTITSAVGATSVDVLLLLDGPAPAGLSFAASSSAPTSASVPATVTVPEGATYAVMQISVKKLKTKKKVTITIGGKSFFLTVQGVP